MAEMPFFDANQIPEPSFDPLPAGDYMVWGTESDIKTDQNGTQKLEITSEVIEPQQYKERKIWDSFTLESPSNPDWAETGRKVCATLCRAVGVMAPRDSDELLGIPYWVRLVVEPWNDGSLHNKVVARWSTSSQAPPQKKSKGAPPAPKPPQAGPANGYMPPQRPQAPQQPQYTNPVYPVNHPAQQPQYQAPRAPQAPQLPPPGAPYPGQPQYQAPAPQAGYQPPQQYQQAPQAYQPPGPPAWAQQPQPQAQQQPGPSQDPYHSSITGGDEVPF